MSGKNIPLGGSHKIDIRCESDQHSGESIDVIMFVKGTGAPDEWFDWMPGKPNSGTQQRTGKRTFTCHRCGAQLQVGAGQSKRFDRTLDALSENGDNYSLAFLNLAYSRLSK